jgi:hypothetical protein
MKPIPLLLKGFIFLLLNPFIRLILLFDIFVSWSLPSGHFGISGDAC